MENYGSYTCAGHGIVNWKRKRAIKKIQANLRTAGAEASTRKETPCKRLAQCFAYSDVGKVLVRNFGQVLAGAANVW